MKKCKHPMIKKLRKFGYPTKVAIGVYLTALKYREDNSRKYHIGEPESWYGKSIACWFTWSETPQGHGYWDAIHSITE
ncbi:MAG: hypothetical protein [Caudoviricetes sp.]|nr:MAG: hypothetical protein [Caudoviricetes sp.]